MNRQAVIDLSSQILLRYYDNDTSLLLEHVDDRILWYGPAEGQVLRGKEAMVSAWAAEDNPLSFSMGNLSIDMTSPGPALCVVVAHFLVVTHYPSGNDIALNQRVSFTWYERASVGPTGKRTVQPRILLCDITNPHPKSPEDVIYPLHFESVYSFFVQPPMTGERLHFHGPGGREHYLFSGSIMYGTSCASGKRCELHLADGTTCEVSLSVRDAVARHPELFLRCHSSHFVNPLHVKELRRFCVTMADGTELPVPEKGYTRFRQELCEVSAAHEA